MPRPKKVIMSHPLKGESRMRRFISYTSLAFLISFGTTCLTADLSTAQEFDPKISLENAKNLDKKGLMELGKQQMEVARQLNTKAVKGDVAAQKALARLIYNISAAQFGRIPLDKMFLDKSRKVVSREAFLAAAKAGDPYATIMLTQFGVEDDRKKYLFTLNTESLALGQFILSSYFISDIDNPRFHKARAHLEEAARLAMTEPYWSKEHIEVGVNMMRKFFLARKDRILRKIRNLERKVQANKASKADLVKLQKHLAWIEGVKIFEAPTIAAIKAPQTLEEFLKTPEMLTYFSYHRKAFGGALEDQRKFLDLHYSLSNDIFRLRDKDGIEYSKQSNLFMTSVDRHVRAGSYDKALIAGDPKAQFMRGNNKTPTYAHKDRFKYLIPAAKAGLGLAAWRVSQLYAFRDSEAHSVKKQIEYLRLALKIFKGDQFDGTEERIIRDDLKKAGFVTKEETFTPVPKTSVMDKFDRKKELIKQAESGSMPAYKALVQHMYDMQNTNTALEAVFSNNPSEGRSREHHEFVTRYNPLSTPIEHVAVKKTAKAGNPYAEFLELTFAKKIPSPAQTHPSLSRAGLSLATRELFIFGPKEKNRLQELLSLYKKQVGSENLSTEHKKALIIQATKMVESILNKSP